MSDSLIQDHLSGDRILNRSCKEKVQDDSFHSQATPTIKFKATRSQNQLKKQDGEIGLQIMQQEWNRNEEKRKQNKKTTTYGETKKDRNDYINPQNPKRFKLGADLVQSEEISLDDDYLIQEQKPQIYKKSRKINNQQARIIQERRARANQHTTKFNILTLGKSGIGKSSFIDCFRNQNYQSIPVIRGKTELLNIVTVRNENANLDIRLFDMPGYEQIHTQKYIEQVEQFLNKRLEHHLNKISDRKIIRGEIVDQRIHCCLFFLSGPWICETDWQIMKKIENIVNIIPIIAKGDTYSTKEIKEFKKKVFEKNKQMNINWFSIEQILRQNYPQKLKPLLQGSFGCAPPFVITCCNQKQYNQRTKKYQLIRDFRWGKCELDNQIHNDFKFLKSLLLFYLNDLLIKYTDISMRSFQEKLIEQKYRHMQESREIQDPRANLTLQSMSQSQDILEESYFGNFVKNVLPIGLTIAAVVGFYFYIKRNK